MMNSSSDGIYYLKKVGINGHLRRILNIKKLLVGGGGIFRNHGVFIVLGVLQRKFVYNTVFGSDLMGAILGIQIPV